jgi:sugar (pentulose or hexulose) kinase
MKEKVTAIFDIGKTNKKLILFSEDLRVISESEQKFPVILDDDGFECDDLEHIEQWIKDSVSKLALSEKFDLSAVNFTTYGATIVYLDENGKRLTPAYNYLKPMDDQIPESLYKRHGGRDEFCRRTASPALGMLNSGLQPLWLRKFKPDIFSRVHYILHLPQYLSYLLTGKIRSEHTSIGCHTALWDFDNMSYHPWLAGLGVSLPEPVPVNTAFETDIEGKKVMIGIGIHDSSSSLAPYFSCKKGKFLLLSTGTWCISMNPFNSENLTADQLDNDCLCYMSIEQKPVKSSRLFLGNMHETAVRILTEHFGKSLDYYKKIRADRKISISLKEKFSGSTVFFKPKPESRQFRDTIDLYVFASIEEAYHQLMNELGDLTIEAVSMIIPEEDLTDIIYITGGFSKNQLFLQAVKDAFPHKSVFTSEIANGSALGAALVISGSDADLNLGLTECKY